MRADTVFPLITFDSSLIMVSLRLPWNYPRMKRITLNDSA
jgi:hypothetical protein